MITFRLSAEVLGRTSFSFSPLSEVTLSLRLLANPHPSHVHAPWLRATRSRLDTVVDLPLLVAAAPDGKWIPDFMVPAATSPRTSIEDQLTELTHLSPATLAEQLDQTWVDRARPRRLARILDAGPAGPGILAEALWDYWDVAIAPYWSRMCAVLEGDVSFRMRALAERGLFALLDDLHPEVSIRGTDLLVNKPYHAEAAHDAFRMTLTPCVFAYPSLIIGDGEDGHFMITYPAHGVGRVWENLGENDQNGRSLAAVFGSSRAAILEHATDPVSTTRLARELGLSPGSVSQHLTVLKATGLLESRRSGRSVLYWQTPLARTMIATQRNDGAIQSADDQGARQQPG